MHRLGKPGDAALLQSLSGWARVTLCDRFLPLVNVCGPLFNSLSIGLQVPVTGLPLEEAYCARMLRYDDHANGATALPAAC